jgi:HEAT repeats
MDVPQSSFSDQNGLRTAPSADPQSAPDYGTLGPGSDVVECVPSASQRPRRIHPALLLVVMAMGILLVVLRGNAGGHQMVSPDFDNFAPPLGDAASGAPLPINSRQLNHLKPQKQAETLLELAVSQSEGAADQISTRVDRWQGRLKWDSRMAALTTAALHSNDMQVRESGVEVELAAYGLSRNSASLEYLLQTAASSDHAQKIWALWALGLMGNRGVETPRVVQVLSAHLKDVEEDSRRWAVEGLALVAAKESIPLLLTAMHDDSSALVREAAACGLAQSGMFTPEQRWSAIPRLLHYTDDDSLDSQTRNWAFQVLADITRQRLPNDSAAWKNWYEQTSRQ